MTTTQDDGGPAFPQHDLSGYGIGPSERVSGMSLRDWFAGQALPWCLQEFGSNADDMEQPHRAAYQIADAMLAARKEPSR